MIIIYVLLGITLLLLLYFSFRYYTLQQDLKQISKRIELINSKETNLLIDSTSMNKEVKKLAKLINNNLKHINEYRAKIQHEEHELRNTIANISHDLRTPITSILGYMQLLQDKNLDEKTTKYISIIYNRIEILKQLIENLFSYSLVYDTSELLDLKKENINVILEDAIAFYYHELIKKGIDPVIEIPDKPIYKNVDRIALKRVFNNLISNVLKYGNISLQLILTEDEIIFRNQTINYDKIDVGQLFDRFFTVTTARNNNSMGLGLTISKNLIEKMNGTISASLDKDVLSIVIKLQKS